MRLLLCSSCLFALCCISLKAHSQTACALAHTAPGVSICFPAEPAQGALDPVIHISAQANALPPRKVNGYIVRVDGIAVYLEQEQIPTQQLSIENNLTPISAGRHTLSIEAPDVGKASVAIEVKKSDFILPCDPLSVHQNWVCVSPRSKDKVNGFKVGPTIVAANASLASKYLVGHAFLMKQLKSLQLTNADALALDDAGNIYAAAHVFSGIEIRKYSADGESLLFATVINSCSQGFTMLDAMAVDAEGRAWIGGHSNACFPAVGVSLGKTASSPNELQAFLLRVNAHPEASTPLELFSYLPLQGEDRVTGLRLDKTGNVFVVGTTTNPEFIHDRRLLLTAAPAAPTNLSFLLVLSPDGSSRRRSILMQGVQVSALAVDDESGVYVAGTAFAAGDKKMDGQSAVGARRSIVAHISEAGELHFVRTLGNDPGIVQALSVTRDGDVLITVSHSDTPIESATDKHLTGSLYLVPKHVPQGGCMETLIEEPSPTLTDVLTNDDLAQHLLAHSCSAELIQ